MLAYDEVLRGEPGERFPHDAHADIEALGDVSELEAIARCELAVGIQLAQADLVTGAERSPARPDPDGVVEGGFRNLARHGPLTPLLDDDDVWEIMVNAPEGTFA